MTPSDTIILVSYFFVLSILAVYGWHRYYLVYLYMRHKESQPVEPAAARPAAGRDGPASDLQRDVRCRSAHRGGLPASIIRASCSKFRCWTIRPTKPAKDSRAGGRRHAAQGIDIKYFHRTDRTGYKAERSKPG